jgi:hypothetical protein
MLALTFMALTALANPDISCPSSIADTQHVERPKGAEPIRYSRGPRRLEGMDAFVGYPKNLQQVQPIKLSKTETYVWDFTSAQDVWIECTYYDSAAVITFHVGSTQKCSFSKTRELGGSNSGGCRSAAP